MPVYSCSDKYILFSRTKEGVLTQIHKNFNLNYQPVLFLREKLALLQ